MTEKQLAVIKGVRCGVGDRGVAWLQFDVKLDECTGAMQILDWTEAKTFIEAYGVGDVHELNGKVCWVETDGGMVHVIGPARL